jgi:hypothetical protein
VVVEGSSDEGAVRAVLTACGLSVQVFYGRRGKDHIRTKIASYNSAAKHGPWFVVVDLDDPNACPMDLRNSWLTSPEDLMVFRIAVVEIESWLLADRARVAAFLGVSESKIPTNPDEIPDPKQRLINLARTSRKRGIRQGLVPRDGSGANVGPTYASDIREFGANLWRPNEAALHSPSLARCMKRLRELAERLS